MKERSQIAVTMAAFTMCLVGSDAAAKKSKRLADTRPVAQRAETDKPSVPVQWGGFFWSVRVQPQRGATDRPTLVAHKRRHGTPKAVFEATLPSDGGIPYWGEPLKVVWLARGGSLLVRLVEFSDLGSPAYAACILVSTSREQPTVEKFDEPGRNFNCPDWADPVAKASEHLAMPRLIR